MQLTVDDTTVENPAEGDIVRLVPDAPPHADWALTLVQGDDDWIEADATDDGRYDASYSFRGTFYSAEGPVSGAELRRVLTRYLSGDAGWRQGIKWKKWKPEAESAAKTGTSALAGWRTYLPVAAGLGGLVLIWMIEAVGGRLLWSFPLPAAIDSEPARIFLGFFALVVALFAGVLIWKLIEARRAARWPQAVGRITKSEAGFELTRSNSENMPRNERVANIAYEFQVNGRTYRSTRFTLSEKVSEDEVAGFLERFPVGKTVPVYYDPANPENCTLDRDVPQGVMFGCLVALGLGIAMLAVAMLAVTRGPDLLKTALPDAILPLVVMFAFAGLIALIVAVTILKSAMAARRWPRTPGTVTLSEVHDFEMRSRSTSNGRTRIRWHTSYMPVVEYSYSVAGRRYTSRAVRLGTEVAGSESYARKLADRYPVGKMVSVFYDPKQPEQSALEIRSTLGWFMLGLAAILAILAAWAAGAFSNGPPL